ncbi:MAG TPA: NADH-quinone oxidoreductase subunit J [Aggregatilineales bacterium]|nr:NADH-quinone oxidoreductase subunit J [Anaerolineales bacterium]HRE47151.1 NADH-quinone oxidoreductase subunit J [Aggregatilineales bacterium]
MNLVEWGFFGILTVLTIGGALAVVINRNLFHSALWLIISLFGAAGLFVMLSAPFLAAVQVLVYIGAIVILIIFAIMLTRRMMGIQELPNSQWSLGLAGAALTFLVLAFTIVMASSGTNPLFPREPVGAISGDSLRDMGIAFVDLNQYVLPFLLASVLLEAAMVGSIVLARGEE